MLDKSNKAAQHLNLEDSMANAFHSQKRRKLQQAVVGNICFRIGLKFGNTFHGSFDAHLKLVCDALLLNESNDQLHCPGLKTVQQVLSMTELVGGYT